MTQFIAHVRKKDKQPQALWTHLEEVAEMAGGLRGRLD